MANNQHRFKKALGQNFLHDQNVISKIVEAADASNQVVIEIGAGEGALTKPLSELAKTLTAYEVDDSLITRLQEVAPRAIILHQDFLKADLHGKALVVVGNLPYYITTEILFKLFDELPAIQRAVVMVQKEYAERMLAKPNSANYSKLSVVANYAAAVSQVLTVPRGAFFPIPGVDSVVLRLDFKHGLKPDAQFLKFLQTAFQMRRKTLVNNLRKEFGVANATQALTSCGLALTARPQELSVAQFEALFKFLHNKSYNEDNAKARI